MYLAGPDPRALHRIDSALSRSDPRLAGIYGVFTRLNKGEEMPRTERIRPAQRRLQAMLLVLLALLAAVAAVAGRLTGTMVALGRRCLRREPQPQGPVALRRE